MAETSFKAFVLNGISFSGLSPAELRLLMNRLVSASETPRWWTDPDGLRYSIAKCTELLNRYVVGVLTQQHRLSRHLYDDAKRETVDDTDSYEDRLFVIDLAENRAIVEWRQFRSKPPLTLPRMVERLADVLTDVLLGSAQGRISLLPYEAETSKEDFVRLFYANRILGIAIDAVGRQPVPFDVQLVNPNPHLEGALRDLLLHDAELQAIDSLETEVSENGTGDLRRSAIARGALHSGAPATIRYQQIDGRILVRRRTENGVFTVSIPSTSLDTPEDRILIAASVIQAVDGIDLQLQGPQHMPNLANFELFDE